LGGRPKSEAAKKPKVAAKGEAKAQRPSSAVNATTATPAKKEKKDKKVASKTTTTASDDNEVVGAGVVAVSEQVEKRLKINADIVKFISVYDLIIPSHSLPSSLHYHYHSRHTCLTVCDQLHSRIRQIIAKSRCKITENRSDSGDAEFVLNGTRVQVCHVMSCHSHECFDCINSTSNHF
jgi:hypothetical protein